MLSATVSKTTELWKDVRDESRSKDLHEAGMENRTVSDKPDEKVATVGVIIQKWRNVNAHRSSSAWSYIQGWP